MNQDILTAQELSEYLKITTTTIYKLAQQGKIPSFKVGNEWRFKRELIDRWLEAGADQGMKKILFVDDDKDFCELVRRALADKPYMVHTLSDGEEAVRAACADFYDLIFLDLKLSGKDGAQVFREMKEKGVTSFIVVVTGYPDSELLVEALKLGPMTVILKPFDIQEIQRSVETLVRMAMH